ncbi:transcription factor bHLH143-like [Actinidia eriantha]|uniref:transcription factor bHLH143-like n=1 Tax=Actinidia eriantha TaxID=165200 RepID=UPI002590D576|nr:transcription factor bHLH143-like [Actinidia eriantha]XP_057496854.1 transcription factor bHLH143-like [Actinidia eriantha]
MVQAEDSWLFQQNAARDFPNLNCMSTPLHLGEHSILPSSTNHYTVPSDVGFTGFKVPGFCGPEAGQTNGAHGLFQCLPSTLNSYFKEEPNAFCYGHRFKAKPNAVSGFTGKRFVIFDQTGNHRRLFFSPLCSQAQNPIGAPTKFLDSCDLHAIVQPAKMEEIIPTIPIIQEKSNENQMIGERSEMHEDTEEINALLYSDDDYSDSDEDEVTSTDRSPFAINGSYKKREHMEEITEKVANLDSQSKRQRWIDGGYKESSCAKGRSQEVDFDSILGTKQSKKDKIRATLKIIESLIPDVKSKDPLLVIEEAINYLNYLKLEANALGVC